MINRSYVYMPISKVTIQVLFWSMSRNLILTSPLQ